MPAIARRKHKYPHMGAAPHPRSAWSPKDSLGRNVLKSEGVLGRWPDPRG
jgi:hypothetical protein